MTREAEGPDKANNSIAMLFVLFYQKEQPSNRKRQDGIEEMETQDRCREYEGPWPCWGSQGSRPEQGILGGPGDC